MAVAPDKAAAEARLKLDDTTTVVDAESLRALRAAQRPGMPDASAPPPLVVAHVSDRADLPADEGAGDGLDATPTTQPTAPPEPDDAVLLAGPTNDDANAPAPEEGRPVPRDTRLHGASIDPAASAEPVASLTPIAAPTAGLDAATSDATTTAGPPRGAADPTPEPAPPTPRPDAPPLQPAASRARLSAEDATTNEDTSVVLNINATLPPNDGNERLELIISDLPPGATLSAGVALGDGSWLVLPAELGDLRLIPATDWSGSATLSVRAIVTGSQGDRTETTTTLDVTVVAVADAPSASASGGGTEDIAVPLTLAVGTTDVDGSESIASIRLAGVPSDATLSAGTRGGDGVWTLDQADLAGLTMTLRPHYAGDVALTLTTVSAEPNGSTATTTTNFTVSVAAVADAPTAAASNATGAEDAWIPLTGLAAALVDADGSETLVVSIAGLPADATLSAGTRQGDGSWTVPQAALATLSVRTVEHFSGTLSLTLTATTTEALGGATATTSVPFTLTVTPVVDAASITASAAGNEDSWIPLTVTFATPDSDGSEVWAATTTISGLPTGATLNQGTETSPGTWVVDTSALQAGSVAVQAPLHSDGDFTLSIATQLTDSSAGGSATQLFSTTVAVGVAAVADAPTAAAADSSGAEDTAIALSGLAAALVDADASETLVVSILGVPSGATLSAGTLQGDGSWTVPAASLATLTLTPPANFAGTIDLTLRATTTEANGGATATTTADFTVTVTPEVDGAALSGSASGSEDTWITIVGSATAPPDASEAWEATLTISGVPSGATLSHGNNLGGGVWEVATADYLADAISIRPPTHSDADFNITVAGYVADSQGGMSARESFSTSIAVGVAAVADAPTLAAANATGNEDSWIPLTGLSAALVDTDGSETLSVRITGVPTGASLSAGSANIDGSWTVAAASLANLALLPPTHFSGAIPLAIAATATETDGGATATTSATFNVFVNPAADAGSISTQASGNEDSWITLHANFTTPDSDGSESWSATTTISGLPTGATLNQGTETSPGTWVVSTSALQAGGVAFKGALNSDADVTATYTATLTDTGNGTTATRTVTHTGTIQVAAVADTPGVTVANAAGNEDAWIPLTGLSGALADTDGSETLSFTLSGLPTGATLSAGTDNGGGSWTLSAAQLSSVSVKAPENFSGDMSLTLTSRATETNGGSTATSSAVFTVSVAPVADQGSSTGNGAGNEDSWIVIEHRFATPDGDGSEKWGATTTITGVPTGARLSQGHETAPGTWEVSTIELGSGRVAIRPPEHSDAEITLNFSSTLIDRVGGTTATVSVVPEFAAAIMAGEGAGTARALVGWNNGGNGSWATGSSGRIDVDNDGVADGSVLRIDNLTGDTLVFDVAAVAGGQVAQSLVVPAGQNMLFYIPGTAAALQTTLVEGSSAKLTDIATVAGTNFAFSEARTTGGTTDTRTITGSASITVTAVADAPDVAAADARGDEDVWIPMTGLSAGLVDTDGSESLTVTISGVPNGATLSAGSVTGSGVWTVAAGDLATLSIKAPRDYSGSFDLTLTARAADNDSSTATSTATFTVTVDAVADTPTLRVVPAIGYEDSSIALSLYGTAVDRDGSESLVAFRVTGLPSGATLSTSAGTLVAEGDGSYLVPAAQAGSLRVLPPADSDADFTLQVSVIASEPNGSTAESAPASLPVYVVAAADAAQSLAGSGATGEDVPAALNISAALGDLDGSEVLYYVVSGIPAGMTLTEGTYAGPGAFSLTAAEAATVALRVPQDYSGDVALTLTAVTQEGNGGSVATVTQALPVAITASVDTPDVGGLDGSPARWETARGDEDTAIALNLDPGLNDADGSEAVVGSVLITGLPAGASLRYTDGTVLSASGGTFTIPAARMGDVLVTPPPNSDDSFELTVTMTIEDTGGVQRAITGGLTVDPAGVADAHALGVADVSGTGHGSVDPTVGHVALPITLDAGTDTDGSETANIVLRDVPAGFMLSAGRNMGGGTWVLAPGEETGLTIRPPAGFSGDVTLTVEAVVREDEGDSRTESQAMTLSIAPTPPPPGDVDNDGIPDADDPDNSTPPPPPDPDPGAPDAPSLSVTLASGDEDTPMALTISGTAGAGGVGTPTLTYVISGVSALGDGAQLSAGYYDAVTDQWLLTEAELAGLQLIPPEDFSGDVTLDVTVVGTDALGHTVRTTESVTATLDAVADAPGLDDAPAAGTEDTPVALNLAANLADTDGSESVTAVTISDLPAGATLVGSGITDNGDGTYSIDPAHLASLAVRPPPHAHGDYTLTFSATTTEAATGATATSTTSVAFSVAAEADAPTLAASAASGIEDSAIPLTVSAALVDTDGSEVVSIVIAGLPAGAQLSAGSNNGDGSWTLLPTELAGLTLTPPLNHSGTINATVTAYALERSNGSVASTSVPLTIGVSDTADTPFMDLRETIGGTEDTAITLGLTARLSDTDGSETLSVRATGVPAGGTFNAGTNNGDGSWSFTAAQLSGLRFTPPTNLAGDVVLSFTATATELDGTTSSVTDTVTLAITAVTDAPTLSTSGAAGTEDSAVALSITTALVDTDGSETLVRVVIGNMPAGATLSAGTDQGDGTWLLEPADLAGLMFVPASGWAGTAELTVTSTARETSTGLEADTTTTLPLVVEVAAEADAPTLSATAAPGTEDTAVALSITAALTDTDGSETLARVVISGLPAGATLSAGTLQGDGSWQLTPAQLAGLQLIPAANWSGSATLSVTAVAREASNGDEASTTTTMAVSVAAVADAPSLSASPATGTEDSSLSLAITAALTDTDGSESINRVVISGLPPGATLSAGTAQGDGSWQLTPAQLAGLQLIPAANWSGTATLSVTAFAREASNSDEESTGTTLALTISAVNDAPVLLTTAATAGAMAGDTEADIVGTASASDADHATAAGAVIALGAGRLSGDSISVQGYTLTADGSDMLVGATGIRIIGGSFNDATGQLVLSGTASHETYADVLEGLTLVRGDGTGLAAGTRSISITLTDAGGASDTETLSVAVAAPASGTPGGEALVNGTGGADSFTGTVLDETFRGKGGNDLFTLGMDGSSDVVDGAGGTDTIALAGVFGAPTSGAPPGNGWQLVLDNADPGAVQDANSIDFSTAASGHIVLGDGTQVEFSGIERITW